MQSRAERGNPIVFFIPKGERDLYCYETSTASFQRFYWSFVFTVVLCSACRKPKGKQASSGHQAKALAEKVAAVSCFSFDVEKELADAGERLDTLSKDESESADRALVMLLGYYLGEHNSEELQIEIVRRGKRMKPLLIQE